MKHYIKKSSALAAIAALAIGFIAATPAQAATDVKIGSSPSGDIAPMLLGINRGTFAKNGINAQYVQYPAPPAIVSALAANQIQVGLMPTVVAISARTNSGIGLKIIAPASGFSANDVARASKDAAFSLALDPSGVCIKPTSGITSWKDLEGKKVALPSRNGFAEITIAAAMQRNGGDPKKVSWAVLGFPQMVGAVKGGTVDAAYVGSPYNGQCTAEGLTFKNGVAIEYNKGTAGGPFLSYVVTEPYFQANPQVIAALQKSIYQANMATRTKAGMDAARTLMAQATKQDVATVLATKPQYYWTTLTKAQIQGQADAMLKGGYLTKPADVTGMLAPQYKP